MLATLGKSLGTLTRNNGALRLFVCSSRGIFSSPKPGSFFFQLSPQISPSLSFQGLTQRDITVTTITPHSPSRTARKVERKEWLDLYMPCQPMSGLPFFRSGSRPIRVSRGTLRLHSALFADAGSVGAAAARDAFLFLFFSMCSLPGPAPIRMPEAEGCLTSG